MKCPDLNFDLVQLCIIDGEEQLEHSLCPIKKENENGISLTCFRYFIGQVLS